MDGYVCSCVWNAQMYIIIADELAVTIIIIDNKLYMHWVGHFPIESKWFIQS